MFLVAAVCDARADFETASVLADRWIVEEGPPWVGDYGPNPGEPWDENHLYLLRRWCGVDGTGEFSAPGGVKQLAAEGKRFQYAWGGGREYKTARKALLLARDLAQREQGVCGVVLVRDGEGDAGRRAALEKARDAAPWPFAVVIGVPQRVREAWVLCGFEPDGAREVKAFDALKRKLGFDPRSDGNRLNDPHAGQPRHPKAVLASLAGGDPDRERRCLTDTPLAVLRDRGAATGLREYLDEVSERLVPRFREAG